MNLANEPKHTPTPVKWVKMRTQYALVGSNGGLGIVSTTPHEFIVRAVNSHEALLEAAKKVVKEYSALPINGSDTVIIRAIDDLQEAIAQAEGKVNS